MPRIRNLIHLSLFLASTGIAACFAPSATISPALAQEAQTARAENVTIETDVATYTIKTIDLRGTSLSNSALAALLDSKDKTPLSERFAKLTATEITIPEIVVTMKNPSSQKIVYQNIKLSNVTSGKAASADIDAAHLSAKGEDDATVDADYGHMHAQGIDLALAAHIMTESRKGDSEPMKTLYEAFSIEGVKVKSSGKEPFAMSMGSMSGKNVKGRAFATQPAEFQTAMKDQNQLALLMKDVLLSFEMEESDIKAIEVTAESDGQPFSLTLGDLTMGPFHNGKTDSLSFKALAVTAGGGTAKIDDIAIKDIDFPMLRDYSAPSQPVDPEADSSEQPNAFIPTVSQIRIEKVDVGLPEDENASATARRFTLDHFQIDSGAPVDATPTQASVALDHLVLDLAAMNDKDLQSFTDMGYSKLDLSGHVDMGWDPATEKLTVGDVSVTGADMGKIQISAMIDGVSKDFFSGDASAMQAAAFGAMIKKIDITITNGGLFDRAMAMQAKAQNKSVEEIKRSYITAAAIGLPAMLDNKPAAKVIGAALGKFIATPKFFHLTATSADGLGAADFALIQDPVTLLDALDIKATANE